MKIRHLVMSLLIANSLVSPLDMVYSSLTVNAQEDLKLLEEKPVVAEVEVKNFPNRIVTTLQEDPQTTMGFTWYTTDEFEDSKVFVSTSEDMSEAMEFNADIKEVESKYLEKTEEGNIIFYYTEEDEEGNETITGYITDEGMEGNKEYMGGRLHGRVDMLAVTEYNYQGFAEGLEPDTTYYYQVGSESGEMSEVGSFHTAAEDSDSVKFIHIGDSQVAFWNENVYNEAAYAADTIKQALNVAGEDVDFVVHGGDVVERGEIEDEWLDIASQSEDYMLQVPIVVVPGNHEDMTANRDGEDLPHLFNEHIYQPAANDAINSGSYFSFDYNNIHFVQLNTEDNRQSADNFDGGAMGYEQMSWLEEDLAEAEKNNAEWIVVAQHKPIFSKTYWSFDDDITRIRFGLQDLYDTFGVDLVLQAHSHVVSRSLPLVQNMESDSFIKTDIAEFEVEEKDGIEHYVNPKGTIYSLPNGSGTKSYEITHVEEVKEIYEARPDFIWMEDDQITYFNELFADVDVSSFEAYETVDHDCSLQHFTIYEINGNEMTATTYEISGDLHQGEDRELKIIDQYGITKE